MYNKLQPENTKIMLILQSLLRQVLGSSYLGRRFYQHHVKSDALASIEGQCRKVCPVPYIIPQKVCICGAGSEVGRYAALILKQEPQIHTLTLYDETPPGCNDVLGVAYDVAHIDTSTEVQAFRGRTYIRYALNHADVVLICGGCGHPECCYSEQDLFIMNEPLVRAYVTACAALCPSAFIAIQTPPIDATFSLATNVLQLLSAYDPRRVFGVNELNAMRAQTLVSGATKLRVDPSAGYTPVLLGTRRCTRVPVWSAAGKAAQFVFDERFIPLTNVFRDNDDCSCLRCIDMAPLASGFATARFVVNLMRGIVEKPSMLPSALVAQDQPDEVFGLRYCATPVIVGPNGVEQVIIPKLKPEEMQVLDCSMPAFQDLIELGRCYARSENFYARCGCCCVKQEDPCPICCNKMKLIKCNSN